MNKIYSFNKNHTKSTTYSKDSKKKKIIRLFALLGALLMIGTFIVSLIGYMI